MPGRRGGRRSYSRRRAVKRTGWTNHTLQEQTIGAGAVTTSDLLDGLSTGERSDVGGILAVSWQSHFGLSTANLEMHGRWGLHVASLEAFAAGSAPDPLNDHQALDCYTCS